MGTNNSRLALALIILVILSCYSVVQIEATDTKQTEALKNLYKAKLKGDSSIDTSLFQANQHLDISEFYANEVGSKEKDRIDRLPGQPEVEFAQYGGYVTVDESAGRALYYYFAEAQPCNKSLPLLLWLNGGPGCSSLIGLWEELGPFRVYSDGKALYKNRYSWNYAANVLFLESPAGVGFSYSNTTSDYDKSGDSRTAEDNYLFLVNWLERFPEYKDKEFYISGESYAGHYVPQLAHTILHHNKEASKTIINLKGILIGNAVINDETDLKGFYEYFGSHALISKKEADSILRDCNFSPNATSQTPECNNATDKVDYDLYYINIYNIYAPSCFQNGTTAKPKMPSLVDFDPCSSYYVTAYLNRPDVQAAMHANVTKLSYDWEFCTQVLTNWTDSASTVLPLLKEFMANGLRVWIFSGDIDARVPFIGSQYSIDELKLEVKTEWHPWYIGGEVGGYTQVYKGDLTFATVREAGHMVPSYQPLRALSLIKHFLDGTPLPDTTRYDLIN